MTSGNQLGKGQKLKSRKAIDALFAKRQRINAHPVLAFYAYAEGAPAGVQSGFSCSKRYFKHAVKRNRVKRQMREAFRTQQQNLDSILRSENRSLHIFFLYTQDALVDSQEINSKIFGILQKLQAIISNEEAK